MERETKEARFIRVAEMRTQKVLEALQSLAKCAATASYTYNTHQVNRIFVEIEAEVELTRSRFDGKRQFSLSSTNNG